MAGGHPCVDFDVNVANVDSLKNEGAAGAATLEEFVSLLELPRVVWCMVPAGELTEKTVTALAELLEKDDVIIDGGNSFYKDAVRNAQAIRRSC